MTTRPDALRLANSITWMDTITDLQRDELDEAAAELRRLHAENTQLQQGYAAARLEIESLRARIVAPAGEYPALEMNEISLNSLPALGEPLAGGTFAGIITQPDGAHVAVVLLPERCKDISHSAAVAWAQEMGGQLPTRPIAAMLFANVKRLLSPRWHWCLENQGASYAWYCHFSLGAQYRFGLKSFGGSAVAVRLIPVVGGKKP